MDAKPCRCLLLACGNPLRGDDGVGPHLAAWAEERFRNEPDVRIISGQQWTPELAEDVARADAAIFIDASTAGAPGAIELAAVAAAAESGAPATHHLGAPELLALSRELYGSLPRTALLLTVGAGSMELGESFSEPVAQALAEARALLEATIRRLLADCQCS